MSVRILKRAADNPIPPPIAVVAVRVAVRILPDGRLTARDAARYLGLAEKTLSNWRFRGRGPRFLLRGHRVWYRQHWLDTWLDHGDPLLTLAPSRLRATVPNPAPSVVGKSAPHQLADVRELVPRRRAAREMVHEATPSETDEQE